MLEPKKLRELQMSILEILKIIVDICEKNKLKYYLIGGTLLGCIRHQGFIPWDDDLDIAMPRKDYEKFLKICKNKLPKGYFLQNPLTDKFAHTMFSKIRKDYTVLEETSTVHLNCHKGIFVDIFPLDTIPQKLSKLSKFIINSHYKLLAAFFNNISKNKNKKFKYFLFSILGNKFIYRIDRLFVSCFKKNKKTDVDYFTNFFSHYGYKKEMFNKNAFGNGIERKFENFFFNTPDDFDSILCQLFGDYMTLPPIEKRGTHNITRLEL